MARLSTLACGAFLLAALVAALPAALAARQLRQTLPTDFTNIYTAWPQPIPLSPVKTAPFTCEGQYALCAYAACVPIPGSRPLVAQCGCYALEGKNLGYALGGLAQDVMDATLQTCPGTHCLDDVNVAPFCQEMNDNTMYNNVAGATTHFDYVSTYNPVGWQQAINNTVNPPKMCKGGTFADCYSAACVSGAPQTSYLPPLQAGQPQYNATCFCPIYTTPEKFLMSSDDYPCGPTNPVDITPTTVIYNGL